MNYTNLDLLIANIFGGGALTTYNIVNPLSLLLKIIDNHILLC